MEMSAGLAADLAWLTVSLDDPAVDLTDLVHSLHEAFLAAVPSGLGLSVTIPVGPADVTVCTLDDGASGVTTSLRLPLGSWTDTESGSAVVFYAAIAGALVDLAADLGWLLGLQHHVVLDGHVRPGHQHRLTSGLAELSAIQQALGVLIGRGRTPQAARCELEQAARRSNTTVHAVSDHLIRDPAADLAGDGRPRN